MDFFVVFALVVSVLHSIPYNYLYQEPYFETVMERHKKMDFHINTHRVY